MDCEKCGADLVESAETCPECGEPVAVADAAEPVVDSAAAEEDVDFFAESGKDEPAVDAGTVAADSADGEAPAASGRPQWLTALIALAVVVVIGAAGYFGWQAVAGAGNDPGATAKQMLTAYAAYDAQGILAVSEHASLDAAGIKEFETQAADAKKRANGAPGVKDIKVGAVTIDAKDPNKATVEITAKWLTDPAKGTYAEQSQPLQLIKKDGRWLVSLGF